MTWPKKFCTVRVIKEGHSSYGQIGILYGSTGERWLVSLEDGTSGEFLTEDLEQIIK